MDLDAVRRRYDRWIWQEMENDSGLALILRFHETLRDNPTRAPKGERFPGRRSIRGGRRRFRWVSARNQGLQLHKEINDLLEFVLLRSGRLILYPPSRQDYIVIDNVLNVNYVEERLKDLLSVVAVRLTTAQGP